MATIKQQVKPILKWVGGKSQIIDKILSEFSTEINNYHEIFLGGGSVLLSLLSYIKNGSINVKGTIFAYDINEALIYMYKNIQSNHNELYEILQNIITDFKNCDNSCIDRNPKTIEDAKKSKESYYYWIRQQYNSIDKKSILGSALFIFLNKTCFRGIYRVGPHGFNVPYGHYKNPEIINKYHLYEISELIQNVKFRCCDFTEVFDNIECKDFIYLDPPYVPETSTSFVGYTKDGFTLDRHMELFRLCNSLAEKYIMSNSDVKLVRDSFSKHIIISVICKRTINSKNPESKTNELIIKNY